MPRHKDAERNQVMSDTRRRLLDAATAERKDRGNIMIGITADNQVWIDRRQVDIRAVRANIERLHAENPEGAVVVQADKDSKTGLLVQVIDQSRLAGVQDVSIAAAAN